MDNAGSAVAYSLVAAGLVATCVLIGLFAKPLTELIRARAEHLRLENARARQAVGCYDGLVAAEVRGAQVRVEVTRLESAQAQARLEAARATTTAELLAATEGERIRLQQAELAAAADAAHEVALDRARDEAFREHLARLVELDMMRLSGLMAQYKECLKAYGSVGLAEFLSSIGYEPLTLPVDTSCCVAGQGDEYGDDQRGK